MATFTVGAQQTTTQQTTRQAVEQEVAAMTSAIDSRPFPYTATREEVWMDYGKRTVRVTGDTPVSLGTKNRRNCFIVISKKDYYLYVYERRGTDTVLVARYDCCLAIHKGDKTRTGDGRTPTSVGGTPFHIMSISPSGTWRHDFGDGRGSILSYGSYFLRLRLDGHRLSGNRSIGIHGSTNNRESVPGRASEGCIRLHDEDITDLHDKYAFVGMKVIIKGEKADDLPFEIKAMHRQDIERVRHIDPAVTLSNEQIATAKYQTARVRRSVRR